MKRLAAALCLTSAVLVPAWAMESVATKASAPVADQVPGKLKLDDARRIALHAIQNGQSDLAAKLALEMLRRDPEDSFAHMIMATLLMQAGRLDDAGPAARKAYRFADSKRQKHEAARVAAITAARQEKFLPAQFWMRRAVQAAPSDVTRNRSVREFKSLRRDAKLRLQFSGSVVPSSNVNNGAADRFNVIDGVPLAGILPASQQALSGTVVSAQGNFSYRLQRSEHSETRLTGGLQVRRVELTQEARDKAPDVENADYGSTFAELGLAHYQGLGHGLGILAVHLSAGQVWNGGERSYDLGRAGLHWTLPTSDSTTLTFGTTMQKRFNDESGLADIDTYGLSLALSHGLGNGDQVTLSAAFAETKSENSQQNSHMKQARLQYKRAKPVGPVSVSASIGISETIYPDYAILFFEVPGGRQDLRKEAKIDVTLDKLGYGGFVPTLSLMAEKATSNVSRFETEEMSISLGFRSAF